MSHGPSRHSALVSAPSAELGAAASGDDLYAQLCNVERLEWAYVVTKKNAAALGIDETILESLESDGLESFLERLSQQLKDEVYCPVVAKKRNKENAFADIDDVVIQVALGLLLDPIWSPELPCEAEPEKAVKWSARQLERGLTRVFTVSIYGSEMRRPDWLLQKMSQRIADAKLLNLLKIILVAQSSHDLFEQGPLAPFLTNVASEGIDLMLEQARVIGREGVVSHLECARFGSEIIVFIDADARRDWVVQAVQSRLRDEMAKLNQGPDASETQFVDPVRGQPVHFLGYELRLLPPKAGKPQVRFIQLAESGSKKDNSRRIGGQWHLFQRAGQLMSQIREQKLLGKSEDSEEQAEASTEEEVESQAEELAQIIPSGVPVEAAPAVELPPPPEIESAHPKKWQRLLRQGFARIVATKFTWGAVPFGLYLILAFFVGWKSWVALSSILLALVVNWRFFWQAPYLQRFIHGVSRREFTWRDVPLGLYPILAYCVGWRSWTAVSSVVLAFVLNWRYIWQLPAVQRLVGATSRPEFTWRDVPLGLYPPLALYAGWRSPLALAFFVVGISLHWRTVVYFLRKPLRRSYRVTSWVAKFIRRRPLDSMLGACAVGLAVCLYFGTRDVYATMSREVPAAKMPAGFFLGQYNATWDSDPLPYGIYVPPKFKTESGPFPLIVYLHGYQARTKEKIFIAGVPQAIGKQRQFNFIAVFPISPSGNWQPGSEDANNTMKILDHVIGRYNIDPKRIYLTGISNGGTGVWQLAEAFPEMWAAVAPVSHFNPPNVELIRHIPTWIFHGENDKLAPVAVARKLYADLKRANANVVYTEIPRGSHDIWPQAYNSGELFNWFAKQQKKD